MVFGRNVCLIRSIFVCFFWSGTVCVGKCQSEYVVSVSLEFQIFFSWNVVGRTSFEIKWQSVVI